MARVGDLVTPATDPFSGQPEAKATPASIEPVEFRFCGFALTRGHIDLPAETWWSRMAVANGAGLFIGSNSPPAAWRMLAPGLFGADTEVAEYFDEPRDSYRVAAFAEGRLVGCLFIGPANTAPRWETVKTLFEAESLGEAQRRAVLSGKSIEGIADPGPVICACFGVGLNTIRAAIECSNAMNVADIGATLRAGTNCGSCLPELKKIVDRERALQPA